jgi:hypothetical protein
MFMRKGLVSSTRKNVVLATVAAVALTAAGPSFAASPAKAAATAHRATDFSSARRYHHRGGGSAAGLAAFAGVVGAIGGIAAAQSRRDAYDYDYGGPAYYSGGPAYYGNQGYRYPAPYGGGYGGSNFVDPGGNIIPY